VGVGAAGDEMVGPGIAEGSEETMKVLADWCLICSETLALKCWSKNWGTRHGTGAEIAVADAVGAGAGAGAGVVVAGVDAVTHAHQAHSALPPQAHDKSSAAPSALHQGKKPVSAQHPHPQKEAKNTHVQHSPQTP
jgi:hypothetical protein